MKWLNLVLEYLKVLLSTQMITGIIFVVFIVIFKGDIKALILRIAKIRLPGGGELSTPQLEKQSEDTSSLEISTSLSEQDEEKIPTTLDHDEIETIKSLLSAERSSAYLWEYRYLNYYLVNRTQQVLNWLDSSTSKASMSLFNTYWNPLIPSPDERYAIISALENHFLIFVEQNLINVTPKGREYIQWRGILPEEKM